MRREGTTIGQFRIERLLGHGGMGAVYVAVDEMTGREVAVKLLRSDLLYDTGFVDRFKAEARTLARLDHPRIARLHGFFREEDDLLMVMEFVRGTTLAEQLREDGPTPPEQAVTWALDVLDALHHAHRMGIVHRDVKPANIIIEEQTGHARLTDFGIARSEAEGRLTQTGQTVGTIAYMAPEQLTSTETDGRADLYAVGVVLFELLTGSIPYTATTTFTLMREVAAGVPAEAIDGMPEAAAPLGDVLQRALATDPGDRFPDGHAFAAALRAAWFGVDLPAGDERTTTAATIVAPAVASTPAPRRWQPAALAAAALLAVVIALAVLGAIIWMIARPAPETTTAAVTPVPPSVETSSSGEDTAALPSDADASNPASGEDASTPSSTEATAADAPKQATRGARPPASGRTAAGTAGSTSASGTTARASETSERPAATSSTSGTTAGNPATSSGPPATATPARKALPPTEFGRAVMMVDVTEDGETETEEVEVRLRFDGDRMLVLNDETRMPITRVAYSAIGYATYTPQPTRIRLFRGTDHWLHVQTGGSFVVLRLDKSNYTEIIDELEERTGKTVHQAEPR